MMNGVANRTAVNGRVKNAMPVATPASAAVRRLPVRSAWRYDAANTRFQHIVGTYERNTDASTRKSGEASIRTMATTPVRPSKASRTV